jgi:hypothetical protein
MLITNDDRLKVEVKWVLKALASGRYELISNSDGDEPYLHCVLDGLCLGIPDDVMQYMIAEGFIKFTPQQ